MVYPNDKAIYSVVYTGPDGSLKTDKFETFAAAAGCAEALTGIRFLNVEFYQDDSEGGRSSISGSLYAYGGRLFKNGRAVCNQSLVDAVARRGGK